MECFIGWSKCINILSTSKWLDDYLKNNDILSSALFCIERKNKGIFDKLIIEKANKISKKNIKIKWPTKNIKKPLLLCLISCFFCISLLLFWNPTYKRGKNNNLSLKTNIDNNNNQFIQNNKNEFFKKEQTPKELAKFLFPENQKLTELAENAIAKGDLETLNELFQKEISKLDELIKNTENQNEKNQIKNKQKEGKEIMKLIKKNEREEKNKNLQKGQSTTMLYEDEDDKNKPIDDNKNLNEKLDNEDSKNNIQNKKTDYDTPKKENELLSGTKQSDTGENNQKVDRDEIKPLDKNKKLLLTQKKDSPEFIFLLPDKNTYIPIKKMIINSQRSSESAVFRKGIPIEYEDFIRSYFISLLQEMKNIKPNEEGDK